MNHQDMIDAELAKAKAKHPKFCDEYKPDWWSVKEALSRVRVRNEEIHDAHYILLEEVLEAAVDHNEGRLEDCLVELAQCGAVVIRMMEYVQAEIDAKKGGDQ